jgi:hypothetical protein
MKTIASAFAVSMFALAASGFAEPAYAATLSGQAANYFEANAAVSMVAMLVAASGMFATNLISRRRRPRLVRVRTVTNKGRSGSRFDD